jgi:hypothetical protein
MSIVHGHKEAGSRLQRVSATIAAGVAYAIEEKILELKRVGKPISWSGLIEVALSEVVARVTTRYGLGLRKKSGLGTYSRRVPGTDPSVDPGTVGASRWGQKA